jgi:hypothetical protein
VVARRHPHVWVAGNGPLVQFVETCLAPAGFSEARAGQRRQDELGSMRPSRFHQGFSPRRLGRPGCLPGHPAPAAHLYVGLRLLAPLWAANTLRERNMRTLWLGSFALCAVAVMTATAVSAAPARSGQAARDKAIHECIVQAKAAQPRDLILSGTAADPGGVASLTYRSCMQKKGLRP